MVEIKIENTTRIKTFDAVRAGATAAVLLFHAGYLLTYPTSGIIRWAKMENASGTIGVCIFFVLSGFLLFYQMFKKQEALDGPKFKNYVKKRLLRILPLYYFSMMFIVLLLRRDILFADDGLRSILYNIFFIRGIKGAGGVGGTIPINAVYWSLIIEVHFYAILPIFYYFFYKYKKLSLFFVLIFLGLAYRIFLVYVIKHPSMQLMRFTPANLDFFALGMLGAYFYVRRGRWVEYAGRSYIQISLLAMFFIFINFYDLDFAPTISYVLAPIFLGGIVSLGMLSFLMNERSLLVRMLTIKPVLFLAKISFSVYIWHSVIIGLVDRNIMVSNNLKFILIVIFTLIFSTITYYLIEFPFLKLKPTPAPAEVAGDK